MTMAQETMVTNSALWAAYGDALGFITELAEPDRVEYRTGERHVRETVTWRRKVGGRYGSIVNFPAGTYSDDTQLRLATGRAIRGDGSFDVAAFAKVELTAWANYALGAGVGSKEAAANLARSSATWFSNFYENKRASYVNAGGNGAAMRIQPHVWAARDLADPSSLLLDVTRNAICTHGHARGILGANFHALTLAFAMREGRVPTRQDCNKIVQELTRLPLIIKGDGDLRLFWLGRWEEQCGSFSAAVQTVCSELQTELQGLSKLPDEPKRAFHEAIRISGADQPSARGSGTKTAVLAVVLAKLFENEGPETALKIGANALGTDTDSIATMAGAILGALRIESPAGALQDRDYIISEASRFSSIAAKKSTPFQRYPDLRSWKPARNAIDAIVSTGGGLMLNGIGDLKPVDGRDSIRSDDEFMEWFELPFGQTILARVRPSPNVSPERYSSDSTKSSAATKRKAPDPPPRLPDLFSTKTPNNGPNGNSNSLRAVMQQIVDEDFDPRALGEAILGQVKSGRSDFLERAIAITVGILAAYEARRNR